MHEEVRRPSFVSNPPTEKHWLHDNTQQTIFINMTHTKLASESQIHKDILNIHKAFILPTINKQITKENFLKNKYIKTKIFHIRSQPKMCV